VVSAILFANYNLEGYHCNEGFDGCQTFTLITINMGWNVGSRDWRHKNLCTRYVYCASSSVQKELQWVVEIAPPRNNFKIARHQTKILCYFISFL